MGLRITANDPNRAPDAARSGTGARRDTAEAGIPRKAFLGTLLAGAAVLAPFSKTARAEALIPLFALTATNIMATGNIIDPGGLDIFDNATDPFVMRTGNERGGRNQFGWVCRRAVQFSSRALEAAGGISRTSPRRAALWCSSCDR